MMSLFLRVTLLLFALNVLSSCHGYDGYGGRGYSAGKYVGGKPGRNPMFTQGTTAGVPGQTPRRGLGVSAWGIVLIIMALILGGMGIYYFSMCYPILCKRKSKYGEINDLRVDTA